MKKTVVLLGDSIRIGYAPTVKAALSEKADVFFPEENCRHTHHVLSMLKAWSVMCPAEQVDLVLFNCGHWDAAHFGGDENNLTPLDCYSVNIDRIYDRLTLIYPNARIAFATTTVMNPNGSQGANPRTTEELRRYNEAATAVIRQKGGTVIDLFSQTISWPETAYADYCHYTPEAFERLGLYGANELQKML